MPIPENDPCITDCRCGIEGEMVCKRTICPAAFFCFHTVTIPGECCPKCGCLHGENQTFYQTGKNKKVSLKEKPLTYVRGAPTPTPPQSGE